MCHVALKNVNKTEMSELTKEEIKRYNRQVIIPSFGVTSQLKLLKSKVIIVGAGGLGKKYIFFQELYKN